MAVGQATSNPPGHAGDYPLTSRPGSGKSKERRPVFTVPDGCFLEPGMGR